MEAPRLYDLIDLWVKDHPGIRQHFFCSASPDDEIIASRCSRERRAVFVLKDRILSWPFCIPEPKADILKATDPEFFNKLERLLMDNHDHELWDK